MIITIDGLDGAGKTTLSKKLAKELNYEYIDKPLYKLFGYNGNNKELYDLLCQLQKTVYDENNSNSFKTYFTGTSLFYIKTCLENKNLIIDRGLLSAYAFNGDEKSNPIFDLLIKYGLFFDLSILLTISNEKRIERIKKRNINDSDLLNQKTLELDYDSLKEFIKVHPNLPIITIDTNNKNEDEVFNESLKCIDDFKNHKILKKTINY